MAVVKSNILKQLSKNYPNFLKKDLEKFVNIIFDEIKSTLKRGERVEIRGFGSLSVRKRDQKNGRNPRTGESVFVPEKKAPIFKSGKGLRDRLNYKI